MKIQSGNAYVAYSYPNISSHQKQTSADATANFSASGKIICDTVAISQTAQNCFTAQSSFAAASGTIETASFDTDQGPKNPDIDAYFSPSRKMHGTAPLFQTLPPLLLPTKNNIDELSNYISTTLPQFPASSSSFNRTLHTAGYRA